MSKNTKLGKFLSVMLVAMLMLSIASPAFAEGVEETPVETPVEAVAETPAETVAEAPAQEEVEVPVVTPTPMPTATPDLETPAEDTPEEDAEEAASEEDAAEEAEEETAAEEETPAVEAAPVASAPADTLAAVETASIGEPYTVTIATENSSWVVNGNTSTSFNETLTNLGIEGTVTEVTGSNDELFTVEQDENGNWVLNTKQSFDTDEYIEIKVDGQDEPIRLKVTDPEDSVAVDLAKAVVTATWGQSDSDSSTWVWKITGKDSSGHDVSKELKDEGTLTIEQSSNTTATENTISVSSTAATDGQTPVLNVILKQVNVSSTNNSFNVNSSSVAYTEVNVELQGTSTLASSSGNSMYVEGNADIVIDTNDISGALVAGTIDGNTTSHTDVDTWTGIVIKGGEIFADKIGTSGNAAVDYYGGFVNTNNFGYGTKLTNVALYPSKDSSEVETWSFATKDGSGISTSDWDALYSRLISRLKPSTYSNYVYINTADSVAYVPSDLKVVDNYGEIGSNNTSIGTNYGAVYNNNNYIGTNKGFVGTNAGTVNLNALNEDTYYTIQDIFTGNYFRAGVIAVNTGFVNFNGSTIFDNFGTVAHNRFGNILRNHTGQKQPTFVVLKVNGKIVECKTYTIGSDFRIVLSDVYDEAEMEITNLSILYNSGIRTITIVNGDETTYTITLDQATVNAGKITVQIKGTEVTAKAGTTTLKVEKDKGKTTTK